MKKHTPLSLKQLLFMVCSLFLFSALTILLFTHNRDEKRFEQITNQLFHKEMTSNTLNMHYTLAHPENFGIYGYEPVLPGFQSDNSLEKQASLENLLMSLQAIHPQKLTPENARLHELLTKQLSNSLELSGYPYYREPLTPSSGMQSELPILLAEYSFRSRQDVTDYLALLDQTDDYFQSLARYEQEKASLGYLMPATSLKSVRSQCDLIITEASLDSGNHFLQTSFEERLEPLLEQHIITEKEAEKYIATNNRLLKTVLLPSYISLGDNLLLLEDKACPISGLCTLPDGQKYYEAYLISQTGSYRPISGIKELLTARLTAEYRDLEQLLSQNSEAAYQYALHQEIPFPITDPVKMIRDLKMRMADSFPDIPGEVTAVTIKPVCDHLENYCAPAFYLTSPLDATDQNSIYINRKKTLGSLELYTTLAHEGYPGHLYQTVYSNRLALSKNEAPARQLLWYGGYIEGWALYVEFLSYDYASQLLQDCGQCDAAVQVQMEKHNRSLQLCLYSLLDIMVHYDDVPYSKIVSLLERFGINSNADCKAIYTYIAQEPCNYLKYYLGYLEILELREKARELWGSSYSDLAYHSYLLEYGPADFSSLEKWLQDSSSMLSK